MDNVKIIENGVESEVAALANLKIDGKNYLFFSLNDFTEDGLAKIRIAATRNEDNTISAEEWTNVTNAVRNVIENVENPSIEFLSIDPEPYELGQVKKLAVKPEWKTAFSDHVNAHLIQNNTVNVSGDENPVMPFFDPTIDTTNVSDQLMDQQIVENPFDKSITPDVPAEEASVEPAEPVEEPQVSAFEDAQPAVEPIVVEPVIDANTNVESAFPETAPIVEMVEPQEVVEEPTSVEENEVSNDQIEDILAKVDEIEKLAQNIKTSVMNLKTSLSNKTEVEKEETPIVQNVVLDSPIIEPTVEPVVEQNMEPVAVEPVVEQVLESTPVETIIEQPVIEQAVEPVVTEPVIEQPVAPIVEPVLPPVEEVASPVEQAFVPDVASIPDVVVDAPAVVPEVMPVDVSAPVEAIANDEFVGMSPTNMQKVA